MINSIIRFFGASGASISCPSFTHGGPTDTCSTGLPVASANSQEIQHILAIFFGIAAVISVLMIVIGAMSLVFSGGNSQNAAKARDTIIYAVVGLVVSLLAEAFVAFVLGRLR